MGAICDIDVVRKIVALLHDAVDLSENSDAFAAGIGIERGEKFLRGKRKKSPSLALISQASCNHVNLFHQAQ